MGGPQTERSGQIRKPESGGNGGAIAKPQGGTLEDLLGKMKEQIKLALPKHVDADRMTRVALTALRTTKNLNRCSPASFLGCVMQLAQLGLEPNTPLGHAYLIPRETPRNSGNFECTTIIGYQGYIDIGARAGVKFNGFPVHQGDKFVWALGLSPIIDHVPSDDPDREEKPITHVYAVATTKDGSKLFVVLSKAQVEKRRKRSAMSRSGAWVDDWEAMALKSAVRALWRWVPKSVEHIQVAQAQQLDNAADLGRSQLPAMSNEVAELLLSSGVAKAEDVIETTATAHDPVTGEVNADDDEAAAEEAYRKAQEGAGA